MNIHVALNTVLIFHNMQIADYCIISSIGKPGPKWIPLINLVIRRHYYLDSALLVRLYNRCFSVRISEG